MGTDRPQVRAAELARCQQPLPCCQPRAASTSLTFADCPCWAAICLQLQVSFQVLQSQFSESAMVCAYT